MPESRHRDSLASTDDPEAQCQQQAARSALVTILESMSRKPKHYCTSPEDFSNEESYSHSSGPKKIHGGRRRRPQAPWGAQASRVSGEVGNLPEPDPITNTLRLFSLFIIIISISISINI